MRDNISSPLMAYIDATFCNETPLLQLVRQKGEELVKGMQVSPSEGKLLSLLVHMNQARHILEIGTFVGYSTLWMASSLPADGQIVTIEANPVHAAIAREHFEQSDKVAAIELHEGKALDILKHIFALYPKRHYDIIFIDAAKSEYMEYVYLVEPFVADGGLIIGDNSLLFGHMIGDPQKKAGQSAIRAMQEFNAYLGKSGKYHSVMIPTQEGMTIARKLPQSCNNPLV